MVKFACPLKIFSLTGLDQGYLLFLKRTGCNAAKLQDIHGIIHSGDLIVQN